jgi:hypothetical protein
LIQRFVQAENPTLPKRLACVRDHCLNCGPPNRPASSFENYQPGRGRPVSSKSQRGNGQQIGDVSDENE